MKLRYGLATLLTLITTVVCAYPIDGFDETGIKRLEYYRLSELGEIDGRDLYSGAELSLEQVLPRLLGNQAAPEWEVNQEVSNKLKTLIVEQPHNYGIALLDISDPDNPIYAEHNADYRDNVGSVGKMLVALALFNKLAEVYPDDIEARRRVLTETNIVADNFIISDHHAVPFYNLETQTFQKRAVRIGDEGNLYTWLDWMLSPSSNAAAAMVQKQLVLLDHFGTDYPVSNERADVYLEETPRKELGDRFIELMVGPLEAHGLDTDYLRQGSFFTRTGKAKIPGTSSYGNPRQLVKMLYLLESGRLVDEFSSIELKRLFYMTERRIRYASHPSLNPFAVYFKSGSLYSCVPEEGFSCGKYKGNKRNLLASLAIIEAPSETRDYHYLVVVQSNVLRVNSAVAHQTLGLRIHRMIESLH